MISREWHLGHIRFFIVSVFISIAFESQFLFNQEDIANVMLCLVQGLNLIIIKLSCYSQKLSDSYFPLNDHSLFSGVLYLCEQQPTSSKKKDAY